MFSALNRLKQRKLVQWMLAYLGASWLFMQLIDVLSDHWPLSLGFQRGIDLVIVVGFFITLTVAWYHGEKGRQRVTGPEVLIIAALLFIAGTLVLFIKPAEPPAASTPGQVSTVKTAQEAVTGIAVLPLRNLSGNAEQDYFVAGMHEALISSLSKVEALKVISRTSVMRYADSDKSIPEIAKELNVGTLIEGSVNPVGDRVRISVQLIDATTDTHLWADEYDRDLRDVLVLMSEIAASTVEMVEATLTPRYVEALRYAQPVDPQLNDLFMRGNYAISNLSREGVAQSAQYFKQAIEIDPSFAPAWAGLSGTHTISAYMGYASPDTSLAAAKETAQNALALDHQLDGAHTALGWVHLLQFNWEQAREEFEKALKINPNAPNALHGLGDYLTLMGSAEEGLVFVKKAKEVDPFSPMWAFSVVAHLHMMDRFEEAILEAEKVLDLYPSPSVWAYRGNAYFQLGRLDEALDSYRKLFEKRPVLLEALERGNRENGPVGAVHAIANAKAELALKNQSGAFNVAVWYARAGDIEETMAWLERAYTQGSPDLIYVSIRPEMNDMYSVPEFREFIGRIKLDVSNQ